MLSQKKKERRFCTFLIGVDALLLTHTSTGTNKQLNTSNSDNVI